MSTQFFDSVSIGDALALDSNVIGGNAIYATQGVSLSSPVTLSESAPTAVLSLTLTMPASGQKWRVRTEWVLVVDITTPNGTQGLVAGYVSDGSVAAGWAQIEPANWNATSTSQTGAFGRGVTLPPGAEAGYAPGQKVTLTLYAGLVNLSGSAEPNEVFFGQAIATTLSAFIVPSN